METAQSQATAFYDQWMNAQKQIAQNWSQTAQQFQQTFTGTADQTAQPADAEHPTANEFLKRWFDFQSQYGSQLAELSQKFIAFTGNQPEQQKQMNDWIDFQFGAVQQINDISKQLFGQFQQNKEAQPAAESWLNLQQNLFGQLRDFSRQIIDNPSLENGGDWLKRWAQIQQSAIQQFAQAAQQQAEQSPFHDLYKQQQEQFKKYSPTEFFQQQQDAFQNAFKPENLRQQQEKFQAQFQQYFQPQNWQQFAQQNPFQPGAFQQNPFQQQAQQFWGADFWKKQQEQFQQFAAAEFWKQQQQQWQNQFQNAFSGQQQSGFPFQNLQNAQPDWQKLWQQWQEQQQQWQNQFQNQFQNGFQPQPDAFQDWMKPMQDLQTAAKKNWEQWQQLQQSSMNKAQELFTVNDKWNETFRKSLGAFGQMHRSGQPYVFTPNQDIINDAMKNLTGTVENYTKIYEYLQPALKAIQERALNPENVGQFTDPAKYKQVLDRIFEFVSPQSLLELQDTVSKLAHSYNHSAQNQFDKAQAVFDENLQLIPELAKGDPTALAKMYQNLFESVKQTTDPVFNISTEGKIDDINHVLNQISGKISNYASKTTEYQYAMYKVGQQALEQALQKVADLAVSGEEPKNYNEVFRLWLDTNDKAFINLFRTDEFAKIQAEMIDAGMDIKIDFQNVLEIMLSDYPIATRSEIANMSKTIQGLVNRVRNLEHELDEALNAQAPASAEAFASESVAGQNGAEKKSRSTKK